MLKIESSTQSMDGRSIVHSDEIGSFVLSGCKPTKKRSEASNLDEIHLTSPDIRCQKSFEFRDSAVGENNGIR
jgi:hypothetical protein